MRERLVSTAVTTEPECRKERMQTIGSHIAEITL
jgi:hypothetical protein